MGSSVTMSVAKWDFWWWMSPDPGIVPEGWVKHRVYVWVPRGASRRQKWRLYGLAMRRYQRQFPRGRWRAARWGWVEPGRPPPDLREQWGTQRNPNMHQTPLDSISADSPPAIHTGRQTPFDDPPIFHLIRNTHKTNANQQQPQHTQITTRHNTTYQTTKTTNNQNQNN